MKLSLKESTQSGRGSVFRDDYRRWETLTETTPTKKKFCHSLIIEVIYASICAMCEQLFTLFEE